jgi:hypothetical protein
MEDLFGEGFQGTSRNRGELGSEPEACKLPYSGSLASR